MKFVHYAPQHADRLREAVDAAHTAPLLQSEPYLRHMYLGHARGRLLLLLDDDGHVLATLGSETVPMRIGATRQEVVVGANTYSFQPGALAFLLREWMRSAELGVMLPSNELWAGLLARQPRWRSVPGLQTFYLNWNYPILPGDAWWKQLAKPPARLLVRINPDGFPGRITKLGDDVRATETDRFTEDMAARTGPFGLRIDPDVDHLNWRFSPHLPHVRYRIFRLHAGGTTRGYVVLADCPDCLVVSQCDGDDPVQLAHGVLLAINAVNQGAKRYRQVVLSSMHAAMKAVYRDFGFRAKEGEVPLYLASFGQQAWPSGAGHDWLVSMDLGDQAISLALLDQDSRLRATARDVAA